MNKLLIVLCVALLALLPASALSSQFDYSNMTPEEIEQLHEARHKFYMAEAAGMNEAIRAELLADQTKVDGNQDDFDVRYYGLDLRLHFTGDSISGHVDYLIRPTVSSLSHVDLNLIDELTVSQVTVDGSPTIFSHSNDLLGNTLPSSYSQGQEFEMAVYYHGVPSYQGSNGMDFANVAGYKMCWTHCSPYGARKWWPCKDYPVDKPDSVDLYFEYPSDRVCASNGVVISDEDIGDGYKRVHYKHMYPITTYLVAVACAQYDEQVVTWNYGDVSMPVHSFELPSTPEAGAAFRTVIPDVLTRLSDHWGLYPFATEKAGGAVYGWGGAMEHQTCVFYLDTFYDDWVIAHENGHQWWGDMLSACNFHHIWLKEGFASYSEAIYFEDRDGEQAYFNHMASQRYIGPGTVYVEDLVNDDIFDPNLTYDKASWVVHMLRGVIGDSLFFASIANYRDAFQYGCAVTEDLSDVVSATVGEDMSWYFNQWIYGAGNPSYQYSQLCEPSADKSGFNLLLFINQMQSYGTYFKMPIRITFQTTGGPIDTVIWNQGAEQFYTIPFADSVTGISFDPQQWILRTTSEVTMALHMIPRQFPDGYLSYDYHEQLRAIAGMPPYSWSFISGDLPFGLTFDADSALIKGVPSWPATYYFTLRVTDSDTPANVEDVSFALKVLENPPYVCGDADGNQIVNISDAVSLINYIFGSGSAPVPYIAGDVDCNTIVNISDAVYLISYIFGGGTAPCEACP